MPRSALAAIERWLRVSVLFCCSGCSRRSRLSPLLLRLAEDADSAAQRSERAEAQVRAEDDFLHELKALIALRSDYVVRCRAVCIEPQLALVLDEHLRKSVYHVLHAEEYRLRWPVLLRWASDAAAAIEIMHSRLPPIVHRDLKTLNLLVTDDDGVRLCDFGCAREATEENADDLAQLKGTAFYAAPEVYFGEAFAPASDIYSLGMCVWELLAALFAGTYVRPFSEYADWCAHWAAAMCCARGANAAPRRAVRLTFKSLRAPRKRICDRRCRTTARWS